MAAEGQTHDRESEMNTKLWDRRNALRLGALGGLAAGVLGAGALPASARPRFFDLRTDARTLYTGAPLSSETIQQSFAFDPDRGRLFVAQLLAGSPGKAGDLRVTEMDRRGRILGWMTLLGYGHAVSFGVHRGRRASTCGSKVASTTTAMALC